MRTLEANARFLTAYPDVAFTIEGNADDPVPSGKDREEYNLVLADRRATAVRNLLVMLGVSPDRIQTISYGKDRLVCEDKTESCHQQNRRAHFVYGSEVQGAAAARRSTRRFLEEGEPEHEGYGMYTYILFFKPPNAANRLKYKEIIRVYLETLRETKEMEAPFPSPSHPAPRPAPIPRSEQPVLPSRLNVMYLPVKQGFGVCLSRQQLTQMKKSREDCFVDDFYDYKRAGNLLAELDRLNKAQGAHTRGPYLVSSLVPIDTIKNSPELVYLQQDLSRSPAANMELHLDVLEHAAESPQPSGRKRLDAVMLRLRDRIGTGAPAVENVIATISLIWGKPASEPHKR